LACFIIREIDSMNTIRLLFAALALSAAGATHAQEVEDFSPTIQMFRAIPEAGAYFDSAYGYAVWRRIARGGLGIGAATGRGQVYVNGQVTGFSRLIDISIGFQAGGQAYRQIIFFENRAAYDAFTMGNFEFDAQASAVAVTASAQASSGTQGSQATAGAAGVPTAAGSGRYHNGTQVFTMAAGGLMYQATIAGQKYSFNPVN
jgi:lipid-binding SYLF domain-containing protein